MCVEKSAISVVEMARMIGLSRSRFYQLLGSAFPHPIYDVKTRRPFYTPELQEACLEVRRTNIGMDGRPILFYTKQKEVAPKRPKRSGRKPRPTDSRYRDLLDGLRSLGMAGVTAGQVESALKELRVSGGGSKDQGEVLKAVFLRLKRQDTSPSSPKPKPSRGD